MSLTWNATADVEFRRGYLIENEELKFTVEHDELYSEDCPICVFQKKHLETLFMKLNDAIVCQRPENPDPSEASRMLITTDTNPRAMSLLVIIARNFRDTLLGAHVSRLTVEDADGFYYYRPVEDVFSP